MKKSLAALAVLGAFAGSAMAAEVTLYGDIDEGLVYTHTKDKGTRTVGDESDSAKDSTNTFDMQSGVNVSSKFGLKGTEDLGNGLKVGFKLENGFNADDGSFGDSDRLFNREASLSVYSNFGTVSFGRMGGVASSAGTYDLVYGIGDAFDGGDQFAWGLEHSDRYDNMITYQSPKVVGLQATVQYSFKNDSTEKYGDEGRSTANRYASFALTGEWGPAQVVAAYELQKYSTLYRDEDKKPKDGHAFYLGGNYDFGVAKVFGLAQYVTGGKNVFGSDKLSYFGGKLTFDLDRDDLTEKGIETFGFHLGAIVPVCGGELTTGLYYADAELKGLEDAKVDGKYYGAGVRYTYPLSNRTSLYTGAGYAYSKLKASVDDESAKLTKTTGGAYVGVSHHF